jgi:hypothetical protein
VKRLLTGVVLVLAATLPACFLNGDGDDDSGLDCRESLGDACDRLDCGETRTLQDALAMLPAREDGGPPINMLFFASLEYYACDDLLMLASGSTHRYYERGSGRLVGTRLGDSECPDGIIAGKQPSGRCSPCGLVGQGGREACSGDIGKPWRSECQEHAPESIASCVDCACLHCYPLAICATAMTQTLPFAQVTCNNQLIDCAEENECDCAETDP